nr:uncharacterized protein LOC109739228 [Aegilops tauschii subsp. strangulata]
MAESSRSKRSMVVWSSLRMDLVRKVGDSLLATSDVVSYLDMRTVCHNWRVAIPKPPPLSGVVDRFRPRDWVMLDQEKPADRVDDVEPWPWSHDHDAGRLFLQLSTGRFLRLRVPQLEYDKNILVGTSDGLLVLGGSMGLHPARLLNPFTGDMLPFAAPIPQESMVLTAVAGSSSSPMLLFSFRDECHCERREVVYCADATSPLCQVQLEGFHVSVLSYAGHLYTVEYEGGVYKVVGTPPHYHAELIAQSSDNYAGDYFLVESAGELLVVSRRHKRVQVFRVDIERKLLKPVSNIGSRALFLGARCLSVDADKLPSVFGNCIYYLDPQLSEVRANINMYDLGTRKLERFPFEYEDHSVRSSPIRPFSIVQTLLDYCGAVPNICAQIADLKRW